MEQNLIAAYLTDEYPYWYRCHKDTSFTFFCLPAFVFILMLVTLYAQDGCCSLRNHFSVFKAGRRSEEVWYQANHVFSPENAKKEKKKKYLLRRVRWHPVVMRELWKWAQCDPNRNGEEGRNDVRMPPQGHHHGKSPFFQNKKKNTGYCNEAELQWDKLKKNKTLF